MKIIRLLPLLMIVILSSCKLDPAHTVYSNVVIPFDERSVPGTGTVGQPVNINARAFTENGCWSNIHFVLSQKDDREYEMWALADYESFGVCPELIVYGDTTVTFTPERTGNHVITFWMSQVYYEVDTVVVAAAPGK